MNERVTNECIAEKVNMHHSSISRIRSGDRVPNRDTMASFETILGWDLGEQIRAAVEGDYAAKFEAYITKHPEIFA